jgi:SAM-dependent methyltransferase
MFFGDPPAALTNLARALRPGGALALLIWQDAADNEWFTALTGALAAGHVLPDLPAGGPHPFGLADPDRVRSTLAGAGFRDITFDPVDELMYFGADPDDAARFVLGLLGWMLADADETTRQRAIDALGRTLRAHACEEGVMFASRGWIVTARRAA